MKKILVVDDEVYMVELLRVTLEDAGFQIVAAYDGPSALTAAGAHKPDLISLDVNMPGMNGIEVCRKLKSAPATSKIPVIILSAFTQESDIAKGKAAGADAYMIKPFNIDEYANQIKKMLSVTT
jgi:DNA-binding response OmpR family regulator